LFIKPLQILRRADFKLPKAIFHLIKIAEDMFLLKILFQLALLAKVADTFKISQMSHPRFLFSLEASGRGQKERKLLKENPVPIIAEEKNVPVPEFSRPSTMEQLRGGRSISLEPSRDETEGLCRRLGIVGMPLMKVNVTTQRY